MKTFKIFLLAYSLLFQSMTMAKSKEAPMNEKSVNQEEVQFLVKSLFHLINAKVLLESTDAIKKESKMAQIALNKSVSALYSKGLNLDQVVKVVEASVYTIILSEEFKRPKELMTDEQSDEIKEVIIQTILENNPDNTGFSIKGEIVINILAAAMFTISFLAVGAVLKLETKPFLLFSAVTTTATVAVFSKITIDQLQEFKSTFEALDLTLSEEAAEYFLQRERENNLIQL